MPLPNCHAAKRIFAGLFGDVDSAGFDVATSTVLGAGVVIGAGFDGCVSAGFVTDEGAVDGDWPAAFGVVGAGGSALAVAGASGVAAAGGDGFELDGGTAGIAGDSLAFDPGDIAYRSSAGVVPV
jgi:hypothetical protein